MMRRSAIVPRSAAIDGGQQPPPLLRQPTVLATYVELPLDYASRACIVCLVLLSGIAAILAFVAVVYMRNVYTTLNEFIANATTL